MKKTKAARVAIYGMLIALAFLFSYIESLIPISLGVPGVKLGLANLVTIVTMNLLGIIPAIIVSLVRIVLNAFTFGNMSMMLYSLAGAALSLLVMAIEKKTGLFSMVGISLSGGIFHNIGQLMLASVVLQTKAIFLYLPVLLISGSIAGVVIGVVAALLVERIRPLVKATHYNIDR